MNIYLLYPPKERKGSIILKIGIPGISPDEKVDFYNTNTNIKTTWYWILKWSSA
jgi:hypothetical protein